MSWLSPNLEPLEWFANQPTGGSNAEQLTTIRAFADRPVSPDQVVITRSLGLGQPDG